MSAAPRLRTNSVAPPGRAVATTRAPRAAASWTANAPTPPVAPETTTVSAAPGFSASIRSSAERESGVDAGDGIPDGPVLDALTDGVDGAGEVATDDDRERVRHAVPDVAGDHRQVKSVDRRRLDGDANLTATGRTVRNIHNRRRRPPCRYRQRAHATTPPAGSGVESPDTANANRNGEQSLLGAVRCGYARAADS